MDWIITLPQKVRWGDYEKELACVRSGEQQMFYRLPHIPKGLDVNDRCFIVWRGAVRGWMRISGFTRYSPPFTCTTTGVRWPEGAYLIRKGEFHLPLRDHWVRGFRGIRKFPEGAEL